MFTSINYMTECDHNSKILQLFKNDGNIPVIIATIAFGMGPTKSRLAVRVLNYCKPRINAKRLNDVTATEAREFITCTLSGC